MSASGAIIMGVFAAVWWVIGTIASGRAPVLVYGFPILVTGAVIVVGSRTERRAAGLAEDERARRGRLVGIASGAEGLAILVAINVLVNMRRIALAAPVVVIVVGLHFLPLARWLPARLYYATSALLVGLGVVGFAIADADVRRLVVGVGAACVLWLTCAVVLSNT